MCWFLTSKKSLPTGLSHLCTEEENEIWKIMRDNTLPTGWISIWQRDRSAHKALATLSAALVKKKPPNLPLHQPPVEQGTAGLIQLELPPHVVHAMFCNWRFHRERVLMVGPSFWDILPCWEMGQYCHPAVGILFWGRQTYKRKCHTR